MKRLLLLIGLSLIYTLGVSSQQKKKTDKPTLEQCLQQYDFEQAEELAKKELATLKRRRKDTEEIEQTLDYIAKAKKMLRATEQVVFIDSFVVKTADFINSIKLSPESGTLSNYNSFFDKPTPEAALATVYQSELGNKIYYSSPSKEGQLHIMTSDYIDNKWSAPTPLSELKEEGYEQSFPFMLSDGITLYYGATGPEGLGGYDLYVTRYDNDEKSFLRPENMGMPFNSPADDYLLAIDELNHLGWLVSNRNQPEGQCCIYIFIPNETRDIYNEEEVQPEQLRRFAQITRIAETWKDKEKVNAARQRFYASLSQKETTKHTKDFEFVVNDNNMYTQVDDFKTVQGKKLIQQWKNTQTQLQASTKQLEDLRSSYIQATPDQKKKLTEQILALEKQNEAQLETLRKLELDIRQVENQERKH